MKKASIIILFITMASFLFFMTPSYAKPLASNYAQLKIGGFFPQSGDLDNFDAGGISRSGSGIVLLRGSPSREISAISRQKGPSTHQASAAWTRPSRSCRSR